MPQVQKHFWLTRWKSYSSIPSPPSSTSCSRGLLPTRDQFTVLILYTALKALFLVTSAGYTSLVNPTGMILVSVLVCWIAWVMMSSSIWHALVGIPHKRFASEIECFSHSVILVLGQLLIHSSIVTTSHYNTWNVTEFCLDAPPWKWQRAPLFIIHHG